MGITNLIVDAVLLYKQKQFEAALNCFLKVEFILRKEVISNSLKLYKFNQKLLYVEHIRFFHFTYANENYINSPTRKVLRSHAYHYFSGLRENNEETIIFKCGKYLFTIDYEGTTIFITIHERRFILPIIERFKLKLFR